MTQAAIPPESPNSAGRAGPTVPQLHRENRALRDRVAKLAALVDHYYCAYGESQSLLERRERELSELRKRLDSRPIAMRGKRRGQSSAQRG
jgi:hypothetical protein